MWLFWMTVSTLYNYLSILSALFDHDVNILFSSMKIIKWDVTLSLIVDWKESDRKNSNGLEFEACLIHFKGIKGESEWI